jgi:hypothetical protein
MRSTAAIALISVWALALVALGGVATAETPEEKKKREMAEIQRQLNAEVMAQPFGVEEMAKIDAYIADAMKRNLVPQPYKGAQAWQPGMTCAHLRGYYGRRDCRYYRRYHGRYYPYY